MIGPKIYEQTPKPNGWDEMQTAADAVIATATAVVSAFKDIPSANDYLFSIIQSEVEPSNAPTKFEDPGSEATKKRILELRILGIKVATEARHLGEALARIAQKQPVTLWDAVNPRNGEIRTEIIGHASNLANCMMSLSKKQTTKIFVDIAIAIDNTDQCFRQYSLSHLLTANVTDVESQTDIAQGFADDARKAAKDAKGELQAIQEWSSKLDVTIRDVRLTGDSRIGELQTKFSVELERLASSARKVLELSVDAAHTNKYREEGNSAAKWANFWHIAAGLLLIAIPFFLGYGYIISLDQGVAPPTSPDWFLVVSKVLLSISLASVAAFCASRGRSSQQWSRHNKRFASALASLEPFLALIPEEEERSKLRGTLVSKFFDPLSPYSEPEPKNTLPTKEVVDLATAIVKALGPKDKD